LRLGFFCLIAFAYTPEFQQAPKERTSPLASRLILVAANLVRHNAAQQKNKLMSILLELKKRFHPALAEFTDEPEQYLDMIRASQDSKFGDFQANFAMPLAKRQGKNPRDIAQEICDKVDLKGLCREPEVAGPGFINLRLNQVWLESRLGGLLADDRCGVTPVEQPRHFIVDYSSPNVAKPMHVGHLRSSVIGDAIARVLRFLGHKVTTDNHIGDWGTQFGMIIYGYRNFVDESAFLLEPVTELARLYRLVNQLSDYHAAARKKPELEAELAKKTGFLEKQESEADPSDKKAKKALKKLRSDVAALNDQVKSAVEKISVVENDSVLKSQADAHPDIAVNSRNETAKLHKGDEENLTLWNRFLPECLKELQAVYDRLDVKFDMTLGESFYQPMLSSVVEKLKTADIADESNGAMCVFVDGNAAPFIVQKADGAFTYGTTDLATIEYRVNELKADEALYVVDARQSEHFNLLFATAAKWGFNQIRLKHVSFGTVMDQHGKPYKTRSGDTVGLMGLLDEAVSRARVIVNENDAKAQKLSDDERQQVAEIVGLGGVKYADLSHSRDSDYKFDWDAMLATTGDTATYVQYAYARVRGIAEKGGVDTATVSGQVSLDHPKERALAVQLLQFGDAIRSAASDFRPNLLTSYLFATANQFSSFYGECPVLKVEDAAVKTSRLLLCEVTARVLKQGLALLGISTADRM
jgi:arginyl-tRNA synthetase